MRPEKLNIKTITKKEYSELKRTETINKIIKQVANILEFKKELEEALKMPENLKSDKKKFIFNFCKKIIIF